MEPTTPIKYVVRDWLSSQCATQWVFARARTRLPFDDYIIAQHTIHSAHFKLIVYFFFYFATLCVDLLLVAILILSCMYGMDGWHRAHVEVTFAITTLGASATTQNTQHTFKRRQRQRWQKNCISVIYISIQNNKFFRGMCTQLKQSNKSTMMWWFNEVQPFESTIGIGNVPHCFRKLALVKFVTSKTIWIQIVKYFDWNWEKKGLFVL